MLDNLNLAIKKTLESRKSQLQNQIREALKASDNDLYSLLRSQWAHRFGVESLEELNNLDLNQENHNFIYEDNQKIAQSQEDFLEGNEFISMTNDDKQEKQIRTDEKTDMESFEIENGKSSQSQSYEIINKEKYKSKNIDSKKEVKTLPTVQALIPLPPKPKYSYLRKWLVKSKV